MFSLYLNCRYRFIMFEILISPQWRPSALLLKKFSKVLNSSITNMVSSSSIIQSISSGMVLEKIFLAIFPLKEVTYGQICWWCWTSPITSKRSHMLREHFAKYILRFLAVCALVPNLLEPHLALNYRNKTWNLTCESTSHYDRHS